LGSRRQAARALLGLQFLKPLIDGLTHVVLHVLQILEGHRNRVAPSAPDPALARDDQQIHGACLRRRWSQKLQNVAVADGALLPGRVGHVELLAGYEDMRLAIGETRAMLLEAASFCC
jgi:hypothetical protein